MADHGERIAVLEEQHKTMKEELDEIKEGIDSLADKMNAIQITLGKQRGFWAGVTFLASIVGYLASQLWQYLHKSGSV